MDSSDSAPRPVDYLDPLRLDDNLIFEFACL